jgi:hypothetical protein
MDRLRRKFARDLAELPVPPFCAERPAVTDADLAALPVAAATYMRAMGVIGRQRTRSVQAKFRGRFRRSLEARWRPCEAWQYDTSDRWCALPTGLVRAPWSTPIYDWIVVEDRPLPGVAAAVWDLPTGPFRYAEGRFVPDSVVFDAPVPGPVAS